MAEKTVTDRQVQILRLLGDGLSNDVIAETLHLTSNTVKSHLRRVFRTLGARDRAHAVAIGFRRGLITGAPIDVRQPVRASHVVTCASLRPNRCDCALGHHRQPSKIGARTP